MTPGREVVRVPVRAAALGGNLVVPPLAGGVVAFAHGSGSSRHSPRNRAVAEVLQRDGLATLLVDLLTPEEEQVDLRTRVHRFDLELLADRLVAVVEWLVGRTAVGALPVGLFGASTGAGAALVAAARLPGRVSAVVSRGGRPDLAVDSLAAVRCPVLLLVGGRDEVVLDLNERARRCLTAPSELVVVPGATHLFEEPGALEQVAHLAARWFRRHLVLEAGGDAPATATR